MTTEAFLILYNLFIFIFRGFREHPILFRPTYKYDPGTDEFDTSTKQRIPSYTDRYYKKRSTSFLRTIVIFVNDGVVQKITNDGRSRLGSFREM